MPDRLYAPRQKWERVPPTELASSELREGADRAEGPVEAYRVGARDGDQPLTLEVLWIMPSRRAAVATPDGVFWTDTPTIETALHRWAADMPHGTRSNLR